MSSLFRDNDDDNDEFAPGTALMSMPRQLHDTTFPAVKRLSALSTRAFNALFASIDVSPAFDLITASEAQMERDLIMCDPVDVIKWMQIRLDIITETRMVEAQHRASVRGAHPTAQIPDVTPATYYFDATRAIDISDSATHSTDATVVFRVVWPSINGITKPVVLCAPDARDAVRAFYYRLTKTHNVDAEHLFTQSFVTFANSADVSDIPRMAHLGSIESVSVRLLVLSKLVEQHELLNARAPDAIKSAIRAGRLESAVVRDAVVLLLAYGIKTLQPQPDACTDNVFPGWQDIRAHQHAPDAFTTYAHVAYAIAPCNNYAHVRAWTYYGDVDECVRITNSTALTEFLDRINTWSCAYTVEQSDWAETTAIIKTLRARATMFHRLTIVSKKITSVPHAAIGWTGCMVDMTACPRVILGPHTQPSILTPPLPLHYQYNPTLYASARINASASVLFDIDADVDASSLPAYIQHRVRTIIGTSPYTLQFVVNNGTFASHGSLDSVHLVTMYTDIRHLLTAFKPCEFSTMRIGPCAACRLQLTRQKLPLTACVAATCPVVAAYARAPPYPGTCMACNQRMRDFGWDAQTVAAFPYCASDCKMPPSQNITCASHSHDKKQCSTCAGPYKSGKGRFILDVDTRNSASVLRLVQYVTLFRAIKCNVTIIAALVLSDHRAKVGKESARLSKFAEFLTDATLYPRISIIVCGPRDAAIVISQKNVSGNTLTSFLDAVLDTEETTALMSRRTGKEGTPVVHPQWRKALTPIDDEVHAILLSLIVRLQSDAPQIYSVASILAFFRTHHYKFRSMAVASDPETQLIATIRSILSYFDNIGLIKFCYGVDLVFVSVAYYMTMHAVAPVPVIGNATSPDEHVAARHKFEMSLHTIAAHQGDDRINVLDDVIFDRSNVRPRATPAVNRPTDSDIAILSSVDMSAPADADIFARLDKMYNHYMDTAIIEDDMADEDIVIAALRQLNPVAWCPRHQEGPRVVVANKLRNRDHRSSHETEVRSNSKRQVPASAHRYSYNEDEDDEDDEDNWEDEDDSSD